MKNTFGCAIGFTLFGESHGECIGIVIDGLPSGIIIDEEKMKKFLRLRRPEGELSTRRHEKDHFSIVSGIFNQRTTGTPLCILIPNEDVKSSDYEAGLLRPGHADYSARCKYHGFEDYRGGGHFSGRLTAPLVAAGSIAADILEKKGILIGTHIKRLNGISDRDFDTRDMDKLRDDIRLLSDKSFAVLDEGKAELMKERILWARKNGDSLGGSLETAVVGLPAGLGEPWFDSIESQLSQLLFSIPAVKGVEFGDGFLMADMLGSEANDSFFIENGRVMTKTNHNGGINGGITNGMPVIFRVAVKPTPSISKPQSTVSLKDMTEREISVRGRHDPAIVHRARIVVDSVTALCMLDVLACRYGTDKL